MRGRVEGPCSIAPKQRRCASTTTRVLIQGRTHREGPIQGEKDGEPCRAPSFGGEDAALKGLWKGISLILGV